MRLRTVSRTSPSELSSCASAALRGDGVLAARPVLAGGRLLRRALLPLFRPREVVLQTRPQPLRRRAVAIRARRAAVALGLLAPRQAPRRADVRGGLAVAVASSRIHAPVIDRAE